MTDPRFTESSCFGKHVRSVTHHIYSYQLYLGCCFCSASFGTKPTHNRTQQQQCQEHATTSIPIAPSSSRQRHARVTDTRAVLCRVVLSNLRSVTHHIHLTLCWSYALLQKLQVACMHVAAQPCTWLPSQRRCSSSDSSTTTVV